MTVKECYEAMGADYDSVAGRLRTDERIKKFLLKVVDDKSYDNLCAAMANKDMPEAFRAAHTIKGVCQNLSITGLYESGHELAELLRNREEYGPDLDAPFEKVKEDYAKTIACIKNLA